MTSFNEMGETLLHDLQRDDIFPELVDYSVSYDPGKITYALGYPITGIEKFLGYSDKIINIANFPSVSITTDFSRAHAFCQSLPGSGKDSVILDGQVDEKYTRRSEKALNYFKSLYGISGSFRFFVQRERRYKEAKGLGESAAIAAAVSRSLVLNVFGEKAVNDDQFVSRFARLVSGSGTRSVAGGLSMWMSFPSIRERMSIGFRLNADIGKLNIAAAPSASVLRTEDAHGVAMNSLFYDRWGQGKFQSCRNIARGNISEDDIMATAQTDFYRINAVLMSSGSIIQNHESLQLIEKIIEFRKKNDGLYFTSDTGPSIVLMSRDCSIISEFSEFSGLKFLEGSIVTEWDHTPCRDRLHDAEEYFNA
ncbi:diphosphomevalonate decarboxylase [Thermoplasmatales archaeon]|nr:diphosphomevalonate decarboxylase [Thermoplasmatales archaeon]